METASLCTLMMLAVLPLSAQDGRLVERLTVEARGDYCRDYVDGQARSDESGFGGRYLNVLLDGQIAPRFSYHLRQRFNKAPLDHAFFDATDWFYVNYQPDVHWTLSAGKQAVDVGGYEYDYAPINLYFCSEFWNQTTCYAWGVSAAYRLSAADEVRFQVCESPYRQYAPFEDQDLYAFNLIWHGSHGLWNTKWSANMMACGGGRYISYLALGNEFRFCPEVSIELDYMNRATSSHTFFFRDCSLMGQLNCQPSRYLKFFAKATYDVNRSDSPADYIVQTGTEITRLGAGVEYFPLGDPRLRVHANYCYSFGSNSHPDAVMLDKQSLVDVGLTWRLNIVE